MRREQTRANPLDTGAPPAMRPASQAPQQETGPYPQRAMSLAERLDSNTKNFISGCKVQPIRFQDFSADFDGLELLAKASCWQGVVRVSSKVLAESTTLTNAQRLTAMGVRFEGLFRMKMYDDLSNEISQFLEEEESKQEDPTLTPSERQCLILSMRLLLNDVKLMTGRGEESIEELKMVSSWLTSSEHSAMIFWLWRTKMHIVNAYIRMRNWKAALLEMDCILAELEQRGALLAVDDKQSDDTPRLIMAQIFMLVKMARLSFQIGSSRLGGAYYEKASALFASDSTVSKNAIIQSELLLTQGLLLFTSDQFEQALDNFATIVDFEGVGASEEAPVMLHSGVHEQYASSAEAIAAAVSIPTLQQTGADSSQLAAAVNNLSICSLYLKQIRTAIQRLEQLITRDPARFLSDPVVFNLCTLYDLSFAPETSLLSKKLLQKVASEYHVDDPILHWRSFRLS